MIRLHLYMLGRSAPKARRAQDDSAVATPELCGSHTRHAGKWLTMISMSRCYHAVDAGKRQTCTMSLLRVVGAPHPGEI